MRLRASLAALSILAAPVLLPAGAAFATNYYVAPIGAVLTCASDGSQACPYASIDAVFASKKIVGGDTVLLLDGDYGQVQEKYWTFDSMVTIQSANGSNARLSCISFGDSAKNIRLKNLRIWRDDSDTSTSYLVRSYTGSSYLTFENLDVRGRADADNYLNWSQTRWTAAATRGFDLRGSFNVVRNTTLRGVIEGIIAGPDSLVENNVVEGFSGDGMKAVSRSTFRNNLVKNAINADPDYHQDGLQSYSSGDPITDLVVENNMIIQWVGPAGAMPRGGLQGIGLFDGWYDNLTIRNNVILTSNGHGLSVYGTRGAKILNNTVINIDGLPGTTPWLKVDTLKDGSPSQNVLIANNLAMQYQTNSTTINLTMLNNSAILDPMASFVDFAGGNYRPKSTSGFIDTGDISSATPTDIIGAARPYGAGPDRGAYEVGGTGGSTSGGTTTGSTTDSGTTTDDTTSGGTTTGGTTDGGTTTGGSGNLKGWAAKFLKPPKK